MPENYKSGDGLSFHYYANLLASAALDTPEPFTVGVYGGWGSGKTSLMRMMVRIIQEEKDAIPVWFNAWRYEKEEYLIVPLLATIIESIHQHESRLKKSVQKKAKILINAFRGVLYGVSIKGKLKVPGISEAELTLSPKDMIERYEDLDQVTDSLIDQSLYFRAFKKLKEAASDRHGVRIVIFVDDLDRCFPDKAVSLLEGIKLVLQQPNISYVIGIAPKIIQAYLCGKYKREYNIPEKLYEDYLEKLVQLPFHIPEIRQNVNEYIRGLLQRKDVFGDISQEEFDAEYEPLITICGPACKDNPRAIVRFLNRLLVMKRAHEIREKVKTQNSTTNTTLEISMVHFGITNALELKWPEVLLTFENDPLLKNVNETDTPIKEDQTVTTWILRTIKELPNKTDDREVVVKLREMARNTEDPIKNLMRTLAEDDSLRRLFRSRPGIEWLKNPELRHATRETSVEFKSKDSWLPEPDHIEIPVFLEAAVDNIRSINPAERKLYFAALRDSLAFDKNNKPSFSSSQISDKYAFLTLSTLRQNEIVLTFQKAFEFLKKIGCEFQYGTFLKTYANAKRYKKNFSRELSQDGETKLLTYSEAQSLAGLQPIHIDEKILRNL
ncbi:MAG: KAP family P-loop NTPase fold protein [Candidatus Hodarchaeales archaeon]